MEISKNALASIIKATRESSRLAEGMQKLLSIKTWTEADTITADLKDSLFYITDGMTIGGRPLAEKNRRTLIDSVIEDDELTAESIAEAWLKHGGVPDALAIQEVENDTE